MSTQTQQKKTQTVISSAKAEAGVPKLRFPGFSGGWQEKKLGEICIKVGSGSTPRGGESVYQRSGIPFIRSQNIFSDKLFTDNLVFISPKVNEQMKGSAVKSRDILLNITGASIGRSCVVPNSFSVGNVNQHVCIIRLNDFHSPYFTQAFLASFEGQKAILRTQVGSGRGGLNFQGVRSIKISLPSLPEQQKIAGFLGAVDEWIENMRAEKVAWERYKKGMMQKIFSQEMRFKADDGKSFPDWEEKKLGEVATFLKGKGISKADVVEEGENKCIRYGELYTTYDEVISEVVSKTNQLKVNSLLSQENDVLMPTSDVTPKGLATASAISESGVILGGDVLVIRTEKLLNTFLSYYIRAKKKDVMRLVSGATVYHIYGTDLKNMKTIFPLMSEQQKIAEFLTSLDKVIESKQQQIIQAEQWKKGLMQGLFV